MWNNEPEILSEFENQIVAYHKPCYAACIWNKSGAILQRIIDEDTEFDDHIPVIPPPTLYHRVRNDAMYGSMGKRMQLLVSTYLPTR